MVGMGIVFVCVLYEEYSGKAKKKKKQKKKTEEENFAC